jgi:hypothetical protein
MMIATRNNVGFVQETDTYFMQYGVNFFTQPTSLLLIGGTIYHKCKEGLEYHGEDLQLIAGGALYSADDMCVLRPNGEIFLDADYLVSIIGGLYGRLDPERALRIMKAYIKPLSLNKVSKQEVDLDEKMPLGARDTRASRRGLSRQLV